MRCPYLVSFVLSLFVVPASAQVYSYECAISDDYSAIECMREPEQVIAHNFKLTWNISRDYLRSPNTFSVAFADIEEFRRDAESFRSQMDALLEQANTHQLSGDIDFELYQALFAAYKNGLTVYNQLIQQYRYMLRNPADFQVSCNFSESFRNVVCKNKDDVMATFPIGMGEKIQVYIESGDLKLVKATPRLFRSQCESFRDELEQMREAVEARPRKRNADKVIYDELMRFYNDQMALYDDLIFAYKKAVFG